MGGKRCVDRSLRRARASRRAACPGSYRLLSGQSPSLGGGRKRGEKSQAIGRSRGGRTTKIHALTDAQCRPLAFMLTGGQVADCTAGATLLERLPDCGVLHGDKGYDSNAIRRQVEERDALANIPPKANRKWKTCFSPFLYRNRNAIERMFCRLKDFRRIATRYDRNATNFLAAVCLAAAVSYWL
jgi:transposase